MTPKEKAKELLDKFELMAEIKHIDEPTEISNPLKVKNARIELAGKKCALIAVDEILVIQDYWGGVNSVYYQYWQEVKNELEAMK